MQKTIYGYTLVVIDAKEEMKSNALAQAKMSNQELVFVRDQTAALKYALAHHVDAFIIEAFGEYVETHLFSSLKLLTGREEAVIVMAMNPGRIGRIVLRSVREMVNHFSVDAFLVCDDATSGITERINSIIVNKKLRKVS